MIEALLIVLGAILLGVRAGHHAGYRAGHTDALLERAGHQPLSPYGRRLHRRLSAWRSERHLSLYRPEDRAG